MYSCETIVDVLIFFFTLDIFSLNFNLKCKKWYKNSDYFWSGTCLFSDNKVFYWQWEILSLVVPNKGDDPSCPVLYLYFSDVKQAIIKQQKNKK